MSYSRWGSRGSGYWYTYWHCPNDETENRDTAIFAVCGVKEFTAKELRDDLDSCMDKIKKLEPNGDTEELKIYAKEFLSDVDEDYTTNMPKNFFLILTKIIQQMWWKVKRPHNSHSTKPDEFQDIIKQVSDAPRLDMMEAFMSCWTKEELENMLEDVVNELNLSDAMIEHHGQAGTPPADLVHLILEKKDMEILMLKQGIYDFFHREGCGKERIDNQALTTDKRRK